MSEKKTNPPIPEGQDLASKYPDVLSLWDFEKNKIKPNEITPGSKKIINFKCELGHSYGSAVYSIINSLKRGKSGCPYCSNLKILKGFNDLESFCRKNGMDDLLLDWDYDKNKIKPDEICPGSSKKVNWKCHVCGHQWSSVLHNRTREKARSGCPECAKNGLWAKRRQNIAKRSKSIKDLYPDAIKDWHPTLNGDDKPEMYTAGSKKEVWWICDKGHSYKSSIHDHIVLGQGCTYCSGKRALKGFNDLESLRPEIAALWHPTKNGDLRPDAVTLGSEKKVWWICENGHDYEQTIIAKTRIDGRANGCPYCAHQKPVAGVNDLYSYCKKNGYDDVLSEWAEKENLVLKKQTRNVLFSSNKTAFWKCSDCGCVYSMTPFRRIECRKRNIAACPICKKVPSKISHFL